jgi:SPP1 family phage portal protein
MFTTSKDKELSIDLIEEAIEYNEGERKRYDLLEDYYLGKHAILDRDKPLTATNTKIVVNHANYITDTSTGYLLGNPIDYRATEGFNIEPIIDQYKQQTISDLDSEIAKDLSIFGRQYELIYNVDNEVRSKDIDVRNAICIYDDTVAHNKMYGIIYKIKEEKMGKRSYESVVVYSPDFKYELIIKDDKLIMPDNKELHRFGIVPLVEYRNNSENIGDFEQVISLIDAYNILQSDRVNDKEQLVEAVLAGYGVNLTEKQLDDLRINKTMFGLPLDSKVEYLIKTLDEGQVDILRQTLEADIHKISKVPNMADENFAGNNSGVAIRYKLLSFEQNIKNKERFFEKGLMERFEAYNNYLATISRMSRIPVYEVDAIFKRNLPQNEYEISQMINNLVGLIDKETLISQLPFVEDASAIIERLNEEDRVKYGMGLSEFGSLDETSDLVETKVVGNVQDKQMTLLDRLSKLLK